MEKPVIEIEIDNQKLEVAPGSMIIEAADAVGIRIPRFCYHKKLSVAANCRMCLVEVDKVGKPLPACATPVTSGMKVFTQSAKALDAQKSVMEFLLINHPLDCPICDQGGACELQDVSLGYGQDISRYAETKRSVNDEDLGPLVETEMTRCIQCTRCVRFGEEITGIKELGTIGRGDRLQIGTYLKQHGLKSELSGNVIDLCPVGALTSKPFRFTARPWELDQIPGIAPHDCLGTNIFFHTRRNKVMRVVPRENEQINETWITDRDRFSYQGLYSSDRLSTPMIKRNQHWIAVDWPTALDFAVKKLNAIKDKYGPQQVAALASPSSTTEEFYLLQKLMRAFGSHHIDHRLRQTDNSDQTHLPLFPGLGISIEELQEQNVILLVGSNIQHEQPLISQRIRKATLKGAKVLAINPIDYAFNFSVAEKKIVAPQNMISALADVASGKLFEGHFKGSQKVTILLGALAWNHPEAATIRSFAQAIAQHFGASISYLTEGANASGAWLAGAIPHRAAAGEAITPAGYSAYGVIQSSLKAYMLLNIEPDLDCANPALTMQSLNAAECVIGLTSYRSSSLMNCADVLLPIACFTETSGTYVNAEGKWQSFNVITTPPGEARPAWKVLRVLGNLMQMNGFDYTQSEEVRDEVQALISNMPTRALHKSLSPKLPSAPVNIPLQRITEWPLYRTDPIVRRGNALQATMLDTKPFIRINSKLASLYKLEEGQLAAVKQDAYKVNLPVVIDERLPDNCVAVPGGFAETALLGASFDAIEIDTIHD